MSPIKHVGIFAALSAGVVFTAASAQVMMTVQGSPVIASYHSRGMCLDVRASDKAVLLWTCHSGANQAFRFRSGQYGQISLGDNMCLTGGAGRGSGLTSQNCVWGNKNQMWGFQPDGALRNEAMMCADIEGGARSAGTRIISWNCNSGATNQMWYPGVTAANVAMGIQGAAALARGPVQGIVSSAGFSSGNMVAAGGGNMVAAGGGNIIAAGGGNIVLGGAGRIIAAGGGNMVAAGGGNISSIVAGGGGNVLPNNWSFFNSTSAGRLSGN